MTRIKHYRPSPAMVVALIALFISMGGVSYGVATGAIDSREIKNNTVRGKDIRNNQVASRDLRNNSARGRDVRNSSLTGADVGNDKLTGSDVLESSLGTVPNASAATTANFAGLAANTVGLVHASPVKSNYGDADKDLFSLNGFRVYLHCENGGPDSDSEVYIRNDSAGDNAAVETDDGGDVGDFDQGDVEPLNGATGTAGTPAFDESSAFAAVGNKGSITGFAPVADEVSATQANCAAQGFGIG
jgi:hypothetical protein